MNLSHTNLSKIKPAARLVVPQEPVFSLPEKVLQFGTGVLLRGLPDYFIDKANRQGLFNGRIVVVKSTTGGDLDAFNGQDGLYTICVRGMASGNLIEENIISASISRVLAAASQWDEVLACATNPDLSIIISNTTEVGIVLDPADDPRAAPPSSFPCKLLAFLYKRFQHFKATVDKGLVVIPTELIPGNGQKLKSILLELSHRHHFDAAFIDWLGKANYFCDSLVDRIVPGKLPPLAQAEFEKEHGYSDQLMIMCEAYRLWAIETTEPEVRRRLSFADCDEGVILTGKIDRYRELKLRLLNGTHTFSCGLALLAGFQTVKEAMKDPGFAAFIHQLMISEISPAIAGDEISVDAAHAFALSVIDRFRNPWLEHQWAAITLHYSSKMNMRNLPLLEQSLERFGKIPPAMVLGLAAHLLFMKCRDAGEGKFIREIDKKSFVLQDDKAKFYATAWQKAGDLKQLVESVFSNEELWGKKLIKRNDFLNAITSKLQELTEEGALGTISKIYQTAKTHEAS
jgi:tagaturonate reductase